MQQLEKEFQQKYTNENRIHWLASSEAATVLAGVSLVPQMYLNNISWEKFSSWKGGFDEGYSSLWDQINSKISEYQQRWIDRLTELGIENPEPEVIKDLLKNDSELRGIFNNARGSGVQSRWDFERFFAKKGGEKAQEVLGYNHNGEELLYDKEQWKNLSETERAPKVDGSAIEGHHINSAEHALQNHPDNIQDLANPDNIKLLSRVEHRGQDSIVHPGGNTAIPTSGAANEVENNYNNVIKAKKDTLSNKIEERAEFAGIAAGIATGLISAIIKYRQLASDPRPWKKKSIILLGSSVLKGSLGGGTVYASSILNANIESFIIENSAELLDDIQHLLTDISAEMGNDIGENISTDVLADLLGSAAGIELALALRLLVKASTEFWKSRDGKIISTELGQALVIATAETVAFLLLGIAVDSITPIPDPFVGPLVTTLRILYSLGKSGFNYYENKQSMEDCKEKKIDTLYEMGLIALS